MKEVICKVRDNPPTTYGDCISACVASIMEIDDAPHFYFDGDGERGFNRMRLWLLDKGRIPAYFTLSGDFTLTSVLENAKAYKTECMLFCQTKSGDHCIVIGNGKVLHDPAWYKTEIIGPHSSGYWLIIVLAHICR